MTIFAILLTILFLTPLALVLVSKLYINTRFWETREYSFRHFWQFANWEIDKKPLEMLLDVIKLIAFILSGIFLFSYTSYLTLIGIWIAYAVWVDESFALTAKLLVEGGRPALSWRGTLILLLGSFSLLFLLYQIFNLSFVIFSVATGSDVTTTILPEAVNGELSVIPSAYFFLAVCTIVGLGLDLGMPLITTLLSIITAPIAWLTKLLKIKKAKIILGSVPKMGIVMITGHTGKTTAKLMLHALLADEYDIVVPMRGQTSIGNLADEIVSHVDPDTELLITDINPKDGRELINILKLARPHILVDLGEPSTGANGEIVGGGHKIALEDHIHKQAIVVTNYASKDRYSHNTFSFGDSSSDISLNKTPSGTYLLHIAGQTEELSIDPGLIKIKNTLLAVVSTCFCLGLSVKEIARGLSKLKLNIPPYTEFKGDDETTIYACTREVSARKAHTAYVQFAKLTGYKILVWDRLNIPKERKMELLRELKLSMLKDLDVVITNDKDLYSLLYQNNYHLGLSLIKEDGLEEIRAHVRPQANILVLGERFEKILSELVSTQ